MTYTFSVSGNEQRVLKPTSARILKLGVRRLQPEQQREASAQRRVASAA
jgi:hypothetical protein